MATVISKTKISKFALVRGNKNEHNGVLFKMGKTDFRFGSEDYTTLSENLISTAEKGVYENGYRYTVHVDDNNDRYAVFSDYSAKKLNS